MEQKPIEENNAPAPDAALIPNPKGDTVSRDAYEKLLQEKRNTAEALKKEREFREQIEQDRLKEKDDQKGLADLYKKQLDEMQSLREQDRLEREKAIKYTKVKEELEKLGLRDADKARKLFSLVDQSAIKYDDENKVVLGYEEQVKKLYEDFKPMFTGDVIKPNHDAPRSVPQEFTVEAYQKFVMSPEWRKLSMAEQKEYTSKIYASLGVTTKK